MKIKTIASFLTIAALALFTVSEAHAVDFFGKKKAAKTETTKTKTAKKANVWDEMLKPKKQNASVTTSEEEAAVDADAAAQGVGTGPQLPPRAPVAPEAPKNPNLLKPADPNSLTPPAPPRVPDKRQ